MKRIVKTYPRGTGPDGEEFGVRPIAGRFPFLTGTAFFPGGYGIWRDDATAPAPSLPVGGTVFVGHNFDGTDSKANQNPDLDRIDELDSDTWRGMIEILGSVDLKIPTDRCFFTNALMGERIGTAVGKVRDGASRSGRIYRRQCDAFLRLQIRWLKPSIIVVLGAEIIGRLKSISPDIRKAWRGCTSLVKIEGCNATCVQATIDRHPCTVVIIPHPVAWPNRKGYDISKDRLCRLRRAQEMAQPSSTRLTEAPN